jgi:hypothetical protein
MKNPKVVKISANNSKKPLSLFKNQWLINGNMKTEAVRFIWGFVLMALGFMLGFIYPYNLIILIGGAIAMCFYGYLFAMKVWKKHSREYNPS